MGVARQCKCDERQYWHASRCMRAGHESLSRLVPTQGEQDFLTLSDSSQRGFPDEFSIRLKKNRYIELLRARHSLENQEGLHFRVMICATNFQRELLLHRIWDNWAIAAITIAPVCCNRPKSQPSQMRICLYEALHPPAHT